MANSLQSEKRARQARKRRLRGQSTRARCRTMLKKARGAISSDGFAATYIEMQATMDNAVGRGILHRNTVSRLKKRIVKAHKSSNASATASA